MSRKRGSQHRRRPGPTVDVREVTPEMLAALMADSDDTGDCCPICRALGIEVQPDGSIEER